MKNVAKTTASPINESTLKRCAHALRSRIAASSDGEFLGSEDALLTLFGVSRPTFRQAAKILENENILSIKRGVGGGYFARSPSIDTVAHITSVYLNFQSANTSHVYGTTWTLYIETARRSARNTDEKQRCRLSAYRYDGNEVPGLCESIEHFMEVDEQFSRQFSSLADNPITELFLNIVYDFCSETTGRIYAGRPDRMARWIEARNKLIDQVIEGNPEEAVLAAKRCCNMSKEWITDDRKSYGEKPLSWKGL